MSNPDAWVELSVCQTCAYLISYGECGPDDEECADALRRNWTGYYMWVDCSGECEDRPEDHECAGGFTWSACDVCGQTGRDDHRAYAERV